MFLPKSLAESGLLLKLIYVPIRADVHYAEAGGLLHRDLQHGDRAGGVLLDMLAQHIRVVHLVYMVAREDQHVVGIVALDEADVLIDRVRGAGEPRAALTGALVRRQDVHAAVGHVEIPRLAAADIAVELERTVLRQNAHGVDTGVCAVGEREVDYSVLSAERNAGLGYILSQGIQTGALSSRQEHCDAAFFHCQPPECNIFIRKIWKISNKRLRNY